MWTMGAIIALGPSSNDQEGAIFFRLATWRDLDRSQVIYYYLNANSQREYLQSELPVYTRMYFYTVFSSTSTHLFYPTYLF